MHIELPIPRAGIPGDLPKYPFDRLEVGDTFAVPAVRAGAVTVHEMVRRRNAKGRGTFRIQSAGRDATVVERVE